MRVVVGIVIEGRSEKGTPILRSHVANICCQLPEGGIKLFDGASGVGDAVAD